MGGVILVAPKTRCIISNTAQIRVDGCLEVNKPWDGYQFFNGSFCVGDGAELYVKGKFSFYSGSKVAVCKNAVLQLGSGFMNEDCRVSCFDKIAIGDGVIFGENVTIRDSNNHKIIRNDYCVSKPIIISDHVWVGMNCCILPGVQIGKGSVIGAGSIVNRNIDEHVLAVGNPAKEIRYNVEWMR